MVAKDIVRINRGKLIRLWVNMQPTPGKSPQWSEQGHLMAGFDYKLTRIVETDGLARDRVAAAYKATGTFEAAQNAILDYQNYTFQMNGVRGVAMLYGHPNWPNEGKLLIHDWWKDPTNVWQDRRISIVADPSYNSMLKASGHITGFVTGFQLYLVSNVQFANGAITYTKLESLFNEQAIGLPGPILGQ